MNKPKVFADFHNADTRGRLRLNCIGTIEDLAQQQIVLRDGVCLTLYSEELEVEGVVEYSTDEHLWVAVIDWHAIKDTGPQVIVPEAKHHSKVTLLNFALPVRWDHLSYNRMEELIMGHALELPDGYTLPSWRLLMPAASPQLIGFCPSA